MKKRILVLNIGILLALIVSAVGIVAAGKTYAFHTGLYSGDAELLDPRLTCEAEGVIELAGVRKEDEEVVFDLALVGLGETKATITCTLQFEEDSHERIFYGTFRTIWPGVIVEHDTAVSFTGFRIPLYAILFVLLLTVLTMLWLFFDSWRQGNFSYSLIISGGLSIYAAVLLLFTVYKLLNNVVRRFSDFLILVQDIGSEMLIALTIPMLLMVIFLFVSNLWLMRHEGYRPVNALGIVFAILWFAGMMYTMGSEFLSYHQGPRILWWIACYVLCYFECMFLSTTACAFLATRYTPPYDRDYIIILGCAIRKDGSLTPLLRGRVDRALAFERAQYAATGRHAVFVPSGGQGDDEVISEGEAMERYLVSQGVDAERIAREDRSVNTYENMKLSRQVIESRGEDIKQVKIAFSTTNYHVFRGYILSRKCGFDAKGISAPTKTYFYPNAFLREFVGLLVDQRYRHLAYIVLTVVFFLSMQLL